MSGHTFRELMCENSREEAMDASPVSAKPKPAGVRIDEPNEVWGYENPHPCRDMV